MSGTGWRRYRFYTRGKNWRGVFFPPPGPAWLSGESMLDVKDGGYRIVVAWLPADARLKKQWPDAFEVDFTEEGPPRWSDRFPKPEWYSGEEAKT